MNASIKADFKKERRDLYSPSAKDFSEVMVPPMTYLAVDGSGNPNTAQSYVQAVQALYATSYAVKFAGKAALGRDYVVGPLEGLWWADRLDSFIDRTKDEWRWTMLIRQPDWLSCEELTNAVDTARAKKHAAGLDSIYVLDLDEGRSVQILHVGSYDAEAPTLDRMHQEYLPSNGLTFNGKHHEVYLSDPRKVVPEKLRTVLRQPVRAISNESIRLRSTTDARSPTTSLLAQ